MSEFTWCPNLPNFTLLAWIKILTSWMQQIKRIQPHVVHTHWNLCNYVPAPRQGLETYIYPHIILDRCFRNFTGVLQDMKMFMWFGCHPQINFGLTSTKAYKYRVSCERNSYNTFIKLFFKVCIYFVWVLRCTWGLAVILRSIFLLLHSLNLVIYWLNVYQSI